MIVLNESFLILSSFKFQGFKKLWTGKYRSSLVKWNTVFSYFTLIQI